MIIISGSGEYVWQWVCAVRAEDIASVFDCNYIRKCPKSHPNQNWHSFINVLWPTSPYPRHPIPHNYHWIYSDKTWHSYALVSCRRPLNFIQWNEIGSMLRVKFNPWTHVRPYLLIMRRNVPKTSSQRLPLLKLWFDWVALMEFFGEIIRICRRMLLHKHARAHSKMVFE